MEENGNMKTDEKTSLVQKIQTGELFTPEEVATYLKVHRVTVYNWVKLKMIDCYVLSKGAKKTTVRFDAEQIENFVLSRYRKI